MSVCLSVRLCACKLNSYWTDFNGILCLSIFRKYVEKNWFSLKFDNNDSYFKWRYIRIYYNISLNYSLNEKCFKKFCRRDHNPKFRLIIFFKESCLLWHRFKSIVEPNRPQINTVWHMPFATGWLKHTLNM